MDDDVFNFRARRIHSMPPRVLSVVVQRCARRAGLRRPSSLPSTPNPPDSAITWPCRRLCPRAHAAARLLLPHRSSKRIRLLDELLARCDYNVPKLAMQAAGTFPEHGRNMNFMFRPCSGFVPATQKQRFFGENYAECREAGSRGALVYTFGPRGRALRLSTGRDSRGSANADRRCRQQN